MKKVDSVKIYFCPIIFIVLSFSVLCKTDNAFGKSNLYCFSCDNKISGKYIVLDKIQVHPQCFTCKECEKTISGGYNIDGKDLFHPECYKIAKGLVCAHCEEILMDSWVESDKQKYHESCYTKSVQVICDICAKPIIGAFRKDDDGQYHVDCYKNHKLEKCIVCSEPIEGRFLSDLWGNSSHDKHNGIEPDFCGSCGRIISETSSNGGFVLDDGRMICGLCNKTVVNTKEQVLQIAGKVRKILASVGLVIPKKIPVLLVDQNQLSKIAAAIHTDNTKGFTKSKTTTLRGKVISTRHKVYILQNLPKVELMGVLAHEFLHVWLNEKRILLSSPETEGFCNLGLVLVSSSTLNPLAKILVINMEKNPDPVYGDGYRNMKKRLDKYGWKKLIREISKS